jgi:SAM-dependent methyltransferase
MPDRQACPSCGSTDTEPLFPVKDHSVSGEIFRLRRCGGCTLVFTEEAPSRESIGPYYRTEAYVSHTDSSKGVVNWLYHRVRQITVAAKRRMAERSVGGRTGRVLDYGCGTGAFLASMRDAGWEAVGLEPDAVARGNALRLHGLRVASPESLADLPDGHFDVVTLWHVLEHVHDLHDTLSHLSRVLSPGGSLFIAVPNHLSFDAVHYGSHWAAWDVPRHLWHFTPVALEVLLERHGLAVKVRRPMWFDSFYVSMLSERYAHGRLRLPQALITGLRSNLATLGDRDRCSSLIHIAVHRTS